MFVKSVSISYTSFFCSYHNYYFWIPIVAPFFGAIAAAWSYFIFVGFQIPDQPPSYMKENKTDGDGIPLKT
ncbi:hypothetical protein WUBG_13996, partial [Wuchereria bancrofti]